MKDEAEEAVDDLKVTINWLFFGEVRDEAEEAVDDLNIVKRDRHWICR